MQTATCSRQTACASSLVLPSRPAASRLMQHLFLALEREFVPVHRVFTGVALRVADHLPVDADALRPEGDELSVEERPLQKPALVFDPLAREAGELGLRTTVSASLADFGQTSLVTHFRKRLASGFRLVNTSEYRPNSFTVSIAWGPPGVPTLLVSFSSSSTSADGHAGVGVFKNLAHVLGQNQASPSFMMTRTWFSSNLNSVGKSTTFVALALILR